MSQKKIIFPFCGLFYIFIFQKCWIIFFGKIPIFASQHVLVQCVLSELYPCHTMFQSSVYFDYYVQVPTFASTLCIRLVMLRFKSLITPCIQQQPKLASPPPQLIIFDCTAWLNYNLKQISFMYLLLPKHFCLTACCDL